jgi:hypothetical protein
MDENGQPVTYISVYVHFRNNPVRASADDARFFADRIDNILKRIEPGGPWSQFFNDNPEAARKDT